MERNKNPEQNNNKTDKLTRKQERFIEEILSGKSQADAYRSVYNYAHMKDNSIHTAASLLLRVPKVAKRMNELRRAGALKVNVTAEKIISEMAAIAFNDIRNYLKYKTEKTKVATDEDSGEAILDYQTLVDLINSDEVDTRAIQEVSVTPTGGFKFKLYPKDTALIELAKIMGMYEKNNSSVIKLTGDSENPVQLQTSSNDERVKNAIRELYGVDHIPDDAGETKKDVDKNKTAKTE
jgi:phage terminase small subunit